MPSEINRTGYRAVAHTIPVTASFNGAPADFSNHSGSELTANLATPSQQLVSLTEGSGIVKTVDQNDWLDVQFTSAHFDREPGVYSWELWDEKVAGDPKLIAYGDITIKRTGRSL